MSLDVGGDLNSELSRVVTELESAIHERRKNTEDPDVISEGAVAGEDDGVEEKALEVMGHNSSKYKDL